MILKLLFNIFIIYAIWQLFKMFVSVNRTQQKFHRRMEQFEDKKQTAGKAEKPKSQDGEYIDYEEIK